MRPVDCDLPDDMPVQRTGRRGRRPSPRLFALCDPDGDVTAYGLTLPDGSAVTVQWVDGVPGSLGLWSSPQAPARLWCCGIAWIDPPGRGRDGGAADPGAPDGPAGRSGTRR